VFDTPEHAQAAVEALKIGGFHADDISIFRQGPVVRRAVSSAEQVRPLHLGYVAGQLAGTFSHLDSELHGLTVWAFTALLTAILLARLVTAEISVTSRATGAAASAVTGGVTADESGFARMSSSQGLIDWLQQSLSTGGAPALMTREQITAEIGLLIHRRLVNGSFAPA
jgi:hypothetical protein